MATDSGRRHSPRDDGQVAMSRDIRKSLRLSGTAGPAQGSTDVLQECRRPNAITRSSSSGITVTPPKVAFEDVRAGLLFVLTFSVRNKSGGMRRIRIIPPRTAVFCLNYEPVGSLAPGLSVLAEVEFQLPEEDEVDDLGRPFGLEEVHEYVDKFVVISGEDQVEVPLIARRPAPAVSHVRAVEFGIVGDDKKAFRTIQLTNAGSRRASFSVTWDKTLPLAITPSEGDLGEGRAYCDARHSAPAFGEQVANGSTANLEVVFDATRWSTTEPFRTLATLTVPGQQDSVIDVSAAVCTQKLKLLGGELSSVAELSAAEFGTVHYGCRVEKGHVLFNDGPESAPFMASVDMQGVEDGRGASGKADTKRDQSGKRRSPFEVEPRDGTIPPYGRQDVIVRFVPRLAPRLSGFKGEGCEQEPLPFAFEGKVIFENADRRGDAVSLRVTGKGVQPTVKITQRIVRFGVCPCFERRDVVIGVTNTGELPVRFALSKVPGFSCTPSKGLLQPMQSQNTVLTFSPAHLGHFRSVLKFVLGDDALVIPIRVIGEASTVGIKQLRPGGIDKLPVNFKPTFKFVASETASGMRRAVQEKGGWCRPKPFQAVNILTTNSWDETTHTVGSVGGVDRAFHRLTYSMQDLALREQHRRDSDAWLTVQRLKRANAAEEREAARKAKTQGRTWRDPEGGVEMGMGRWMENEDPTPKLPRAQDDPLFLHVPLACQVKGNEAAEAKADVDKLITKKFKPRPATQAEARDCAAVVGREQLAKVKLHFRTLDFGQVTIGSANVRNLAITNTLAHAVLAELLDVEEQAELQGSRPLAQVVPAGATAGFDVHFKCSTEQVYRKAFKVSINKGAVHQFSLLAHALPVKVELDRHEVVMKFPPGSLEATLRHPLTLINEGNATASFSWTTRGAFTVSPEKGCIGPKGTLDSEVVWAPQPGCKAAESLILKVEGGQEKSLPVSGQLPEARCRFVSPGARGSAHFAASTTLAAAGDTRVGAIPTTSGDKSSTVTHAAAGSATPVGGGSINFGRASVGVEVTRTVMLQNTGKAPAVFFINASDTKLIGIDVNPTHGLVEPKQACELTAVLCATRELRLDGMTLSADIRGGRPAKILLSGHACVPDVLLAEEAFDFGNLTAGGCEILDVNLVNRGPTPASLTLNLSLHAEFCLERTLPSSVTHHTMVAADVIGVEGENQDDRGTSGIEELDSFDGGSHDASLLSSGGGRSHICGPRRWQLYVAAGDTLRFGLTFRPERPREHSFQLPLSLEGIPSEGTRRLCVPVHAVGLKPTLKFTSTEVDFGRRIVSRDPCALKQYQGEFVLKNVSEKGLCWVLDDAFLHEPGPRAEGVIEQGAPVIPHHSGADASTGPVTPALFVSPTSGQLSPGEESRIRLTFTPKRAGTLSFALPIWLAREPVEGIRPYMTLRVQGYGVYPCLSLTPHPVELPVVPLSLTSRATFTVENNGFSDMEVSYRLPQHCPVDLVVSFPDGRQLGAGVERIAVEISFRSSKPVGFSCVMDIFDADGGVYPLHIRGCADNCLLTNFPFVEAYRDRFQFWAKDGKAVMFMNEGQIKAQEATYFKDRQAKRARAKAKQNASTAAKEQQQQKQQPNTTVPAAAAVTISDPTSLEQSEPASFTAGTGGSGVGGDDRADAGVDLSEKPYAMGADDAGVRVLCSWLNANVATTYIEDFPASIIEAHGRPALEAIETMSGKRIPGQVWRKLGPVTVAGVGGGGGAKADNRVASLMDQYQQMLKFLKEKGCLLNCLPAEDLLARADYARARTSGGIKNRSGGGVGGEALETSPYSVDRANDHDDSRDDEWAHRSRAAWSTVMYQCIRTFMLARVTPRALSALPGVFIVLPTKKAGGKGGAGKVEVDPELAGSNVLSVGEGVLLKWLSYHLEQANRTCMPKRVATFSDDLADGAILCQTVASHVPFLAAKGEALHGFIPVHSTGELSDQNNRELNVSKLLTAMTKLRIDFGLSADDVLDISDRDGVLLALHLFQALPQMVPKAEVEFRANLGSTVSKIIELKNPSNKAISYDVTLDGSPDFRAKRNEIHLEPGKEAGFTVELLPRFSSPVEARLTFWATRNKGGMAPASNMVFALKSKVESVKAISTTEVKAICYEPQRISLQVSNPFETSAKNAADGRFTVRLKQAMVAEHPSVASLALPVGRRASVAAARRRASSVHVSSVASKLVPSVASTGSGGGKSKQSREGPRGRAGPQGSKDVTGTVEETNAVRAEVEAALKLPFHSDQESVSIPPGSTATLHLLLLPFSPGEYRCTAMFWNERLGEFAQEIKAMVELPLPIAELPLRVTAQDGGSGGGEAIQRDLLLPSKNLALQNALLGVLLERFQSDRKTRARQAMITLFTDSQSDRPINVNPSSTAMSECASAPFSLEVDSPFFQLSKDTVLLAIESLGGDTGGGGNSARNMSRGDGSGRTAVGPAGGLGGGNKRRDLPRKAELLHPVGRRSSGGVAAEVAGGEGPAASLFTNATLLNFFPRAAGAYPCRVLVKRRLKHMVDVRCVNVAAVVDAPSTATSLVFRAPAGQKITQEIPIHNNGDVSWTLNAIPRQAPFSGPNQLIVPARGAAAYPLTFSPLRAMEEEFVSKLVLADMKDKARPAKFEFELRGTAEEPLAEGHRVVRCSARERVEQVFLLTNTSGKDLEYTVDSDLPGVNGSPTVLVPARGETMYRLSVCPQFGGTSTGSLTFTAPGGVIVWYTVEVQATNPMEEDVVCISTVLRQAVSVEISLSNPLDEALQFQISLQGEGLLGDPIFELEPLASSTYTLYYSPLRVQTHSGSVTFSADAVGQFWYRLDLRAEPCPPVRLDPMSCPVGATYTVLVSVDNPVGRDVVLASKTSNHRNFSVEPSQIAMDPYGTTSFQVVYTPSSLGTPELGDVILSHPELGDWVFEAQGIGEMPGVMAEHRAAAVVGSTASTMFPFRNPFPEPLLLMIVLKLSGEHVGEVHDDGETPPVRDSGGGPARPTDDDERPIRRGSYGGGDGGTVRGNIGIESGIEGAMQPTRAPFVLLLKKTNDLVLQPFQALQIPLSFSPEVIVEERACVEVRGQLGGRSLNWAFPVVGAGEAPGGLRVFSIRCASKSSTREDFEVDLVGLSEVDGEEMFEFELVLPDDAVVRRLLDRALTVVPITSTLSHPRQMLKFQMSLEPLKPFRAIVEVVVKRKTGGGRWRYEVKVEATDPPPDDHISLRAPVGGASSAVFRLCNRYLGYASFQAFFTAESALSLSVEPSDGVLTPFGTDGTLVTVTYSPTRYASTQKGLLIVETDDIRWSYSVTGEFPDFRPPSGVASKVDSGSHSGSRTNLRVAGAPKTRSIRTFGEESTAIDP